MNPNVNTEIIIKPYRCETYNIHDTTYASKLCVSFYTLEEVIQSKFNIFTENLMNDKQIDRISLLRAIDDFTKSETDKILFRHYTWLSFTDIAFNYRPHQNCCIM